MSQLETMFDTCCPGPQPIVGSSVRVDLGGSVFELTSSSAGWIEAMTGRFEGFLTGGSPDFTIEYRLGAAHGRRPSIIIDSSRRHAFIQGNGNVEHVDGFLRSVLPRLATPALVVHAALLTEGDRGWLCCGEPGAGKSTLASLLPEAALCDELALVRLAGSGVEALSLPFRHARPGRTRLVGVHLLEHGEENRLTTLSPIEGAQALRRHVYWPTESQTAAAEAFATFGELVSMLPVSRLSFRPDAAVWTTILEGD